MRSQSFPGMAGSSTVWGSLRIKNCKFMNPRHKFYQYYSQHVKFILLNVFKLRPLVFPLTNNLHLILLNLI